MRLLLRLALVTAGGYLLVICVARLIAFALGMPAWPHDGTMTHADWAALNGAIGLMNVVFGAVEVNKR